MTKTIQCPKCGNELELSFDRETADDGVFYVLTELKCYDGCAFDADETEQIENNNPVTCEDIDESMNSMFELEAECQELNFF